MTERTRTDTSRLMERPEEPIQRPKTSISRRFT